MHVNTFIAYSGLIASVWLCLGVAIAAHHYPGYSHRKQFCSELGAKGSPTQRLSPVINNYPLGVLFIVFGIYVIENQPSYPGWILIGTMIIVHGLGTWVAGYYPMDKDPYTTRPSREGKVHGTAGFFMLVSLLIASLATACSSTFPVWLRLASVISLIGCVTFSAILAHAYKRKTNPGLHQRISYGFQLLWLALLSLHLAG